MKRIIITLICVLSCFISVPAQAELAFDIKSHDLNLNVYPNKTITIKESISANFKREQKGLIKSIWANDYTAPGNSPLKVQVQNIRTNKTVEFSESDYSYNLKLYDPVKKAYGLQTYNISYDYKMSTRTDSQRKNLWFEITPYDTDVNIEKLSFTIKMPYPITKDMISIHARKKNVNNTNKLTTFKVDTQTNTIYGFTDKLAIGDGVFFKFNGPDNYFKASTTASSADTNANTTSTPVNSASTNVSATNTNSPQKSYSQKSNTKNLLRENPTIPNLPNINISWSMFGLLFISQVMVWIFYAEKRSPHKNSTALPKTSPDVYDSSIAQDGLTGREIAAQLLSIAARGYIKIEKAGSDYILTKLKDFRSALDIDKQVLRIFFNHTRDRASIYNTQKYKFTSSIIKNINNKKAVQESTGTFAVTTFLILTYMDSIHIILRAIFDPSIPVAVINILVSILIGFLASSVLTPIKNLFIYKQKMTRKVQNKAILSFTIGGILTIAITIPLVNTLIDIAKNGDVLPLIVYCWIIISFIIWIKGIKSDTTYNAITTASGVINFANTKSSTELAKLSETAPEYIKQIIPIALNVGVADRILSKLSKTNSIPEVFENIPYQNNLEEFTNLVTELY